ncbi:MAG: hypothetical protein K2X28_02110 [Alphaproteobacteria bacterium]|nr:hypothetical protein [Alphaproteobacteria bacterium]
MKMNHRVIHKLLPELIEEKRRHSKSNILFFNNFKKPQREQPLKGIIDSKKLSTGKN